MPFSGLAAYKTGFMSTTAEDVSDVVSMISPMETPLLDIIGDAAYPVTNYLHEWLEDDLSPNTVATSGVVADTTVNTTITLKGGLAQRLMPYAVLADNKFDDPEHMQILSISGDDVVVKRGFSGTTPKSFAANDTFMVVAEAHLDGRDVSVDISGVRSRKGNYTQIFMKDVWLAGSLRAVKMLGGIESEFDYQVQNRLREALRDLNKAIIRGRLSGNTIGSSTAPRTLGGLLATITTNSVSSAITFGDTNAKFTAVLNSAFEKAWIPGGSDIDLIICGSKFKERIDMLNDLRVRTVQQEREYSNVVDVYRGTYGQYRTLLERWMPAHKALLISTKRVAVVPMQGRSFHYEPVSKTGDSDKGYVLGEYTLELRNEPGCAVITMSDSTFKASGPTP